MVTRSSDAPVGVQSPRAVPSSSPPYLLEHALADVQMPFIENWGTLAASWGMDRDVGRIHALVYLSPDPVPLETIVERLSIGHERCASFMRTLTRWGVVEEVSHGSGTGYVAETDPWKWFVTSIRERRRAEFVPVLMSVRNVRDLARDLSRQTSGQTRLALEQTCARIDRFTRFVEDVGKLIDAMTVMGAAPMAKLMKTVARFVPQR